VRLVTEIGGDDRGIWVLAKLREIHGAGLAVSGAPVHLWSYTMASAPMDTRNFTYMFYGFLAAWLILIVYVVSLATREKRLQKALDDVKRLVDDRERK
jgi:CcmD family protein